MDNNLTNEYIDNAIDALIKAFGIKESFNHEKLVYLVIPNTIQEAIKSIAIQLGLPIEISLSYVSKYFDTKNKSRFYSSALSRINNRGSEGIVAQVTIPNYVPAYGSKALEGFLINVKVGEDYYKQPETFISIMAHELSHILLHSIMHPEKDNEIYTDLVPLILGFSDVIEKGRKVVLTEFVGDKAITNTIRYGYLTDNQFEFALNKIRKIISAYKTKKSKSFYYEKMLKEQIHKTQRNIILLKEYMEYLDSHCFRTYKLNDANRIVAIHQLGYLYAIEELIWDCNKMLKEHAYLTKPLTYYTRENILEIDKYNSKSQYMLSTLIEKCNKLESDIKLLSKYISFWNKIRIKKRCYSK